MLLVIFVFPLKLLKGGRKVRRITIMANTSKVRVEIVDYVDDHFKRCGNEGQNLRQHQFSGLYRSSILKPVIEWFEYDEPIGISSSSESASPVPFLWQRPNKILHVPVKIKVYCFIKPD